jgi:hypothetical protein
MRDAFDSQDDCRAQFGLKSLLESKLGDSAVFKSL